jgi:hypothetical protein
MCLLAEARELLPEGLISLFASGIDSWRVRALFTRHKYLFEKLDYSLLICLLLVIYLPPLQMLTKS